jgi:N-acetylglucosaminyldiphosphoundecaprenol N-acetyl-beta-D-mannosaminyltransferase
MTETLDQLEDFIRAGRENGNGHQVATVNVDFLVNAYHDPEQLYMLQNVSLAMPDGMPIVWGARGLGAPMVERVAGVDVVLRLAERSAQIGYSIYLLGAAPGVAARAAEILQDKYPGLKIAGVKSPMIRSIEETDPGIIEEIRLARPDILLVAFGNPKQEKWIARYGEQLQVPVMIGVGGTLDFISGTKKRAPEWMQRSGLEWVHRLLQEPGRLWRRYSRDMFVFGRLFAIQWWRMRPTNRETASLPSEKPFHFGDNTVISAPGCLSVENIQAFSRLVEETLVATPEVIIDLSHVTRLDASAVGALVGLTRQAREQGGGLALVNVPLSIRKTLEFLQLHKFFQIYLDHANSQDAVISMAKPELG